MLNQTLVAERLGIIRGSVKRLKLLAQIPPEQFSQDEDVVDIAENRLRRAIEALFDLGRHIVVKSGSGVPSDYRAVIDMLKESQVLPQEFARQIEGMSGYRNRLIHDYNKVTPEELYEIIQTRLSDFTLFCQYIVDYLQKCPEKQV